MLEIKPHLAHVQRMQIGDFTRHGYLRLDMNENPDGLPTEFVRQAISELDSEYLSTYPEYSGLIAKIAAHNGIQPENVCLSNGSDGAIKYIFDSYVVPGDRVLLTEPTFAMYPIYCLIFDAQEVSVSYSPDFSLDMKRFLEGITPEVRLAVLVNPNNPTGVAVGRDELDEMIRTCYKNNVLCIVDEAYFYYHDISVVSLVNLYDNLIVLRTFSKMCGIASLRIGYAAACPQIIENLGKVKPTFDVNGVAVALAEKILDNPQVIDEQIRAFKSGREYIVRQLITHGIAHQVGHANSILIRCSGRVQNFIEELATRKVLVSGGFKQDFLKNYIRVSIGNVESMKAFWKAFHPIWQMEI